MSRTIRRRPVSYPDNLHLVRRPRPVCWSGVSRGLEAIDCEFQDVLCADQGRRLKDYPWVG